MNRHGSSKSLLRSDIKPSEQSSNNFEASEGYLNETTSNTSKKLGNKL